MEDIDLHASVQKQTCYSVLLGKPGIQYMSKHLAPKIVHGLTKIYMEIRKDFNKINYLANFTDRCIYSYSDVLTC